MANRRRPRKLLVGGAVAVVVVAGGGIAWASTRNSGPTYRLAIVSRGNVSQTVTEVGTISSAEQATLAFPVGGTVGTVKVKVGDEVTAGQTVATLQTESLQSEVESAKATVADAEQRLASDQDTQTASVTTSADITSDATSDTTSDTTSDAVSSVREIAFVTAAQPSGGAHPTAAPSSSAPSGHGTGGTGATSPAQAKAAVKKAQHAVTTAQAKVDTDLKGSARSGGKGGLAGDTTAVSSACSSSTAAITTSSSPSGSIDGQLPGAPDGLAVQLTGTGVTGQALHLSTTVQNGSYHFDSLRPSSVYDLVLGSTSSGVTFAGTCTTALNTMRADEATTAADENSLNSAIGDLDDAVTAYLKVVQSSAASSGSGRTSGSGSGSGSTSGSGTNAHASTAPTAGHSSSGSTSNRSSTGSSGGSGSANSSGTGSSASTTITAEQIAADQKAIDAANAELAVANEDRAQAVLATPITGTVATVAISAGSSVSAGSSSATIAVIGNGQKEIATTVGISDIELVKKGDTASVTVDGVAKPLAGSVSLIGIMNTTGTSGTTTTYPATVLLNKTALPLYDGAGATVAIQVGTKKNVLTVPSSAVHTTVLGPVVDVYSGGKVVATRVQTGVRSLSTTQITSGLTIGQRVVLAVVSAAVPSSTSTTTRLGGSLLTGGGLGGAGGFGGTGGGRRGGS